MPGSQDKETDMDSIIPIYDATMLILNCNYLAEFTFDENTIIIVEFSKVSSISYKAEFETIVEGGGIMHIVPKNTSSPNTLVFEKGVYVHPMVELYFQTGRYIQSGLIKVFNNSKICKQYTFYNGVITEWELGELDALSGKVLIQKFKVSYTDLKCESL